jgi:hypothetical protein
MLHKITLAQPRPTHKVWLEYADGEAGEVDFGPVIARGGLFDTLRDPAVFEKVHIGEHGRYIEFPGGVDFCADALRDRISHAPQNADATNR